MSRSRDLLTHPLVRKAAVRGAAVAGTAAMASTAGGFAAASYFARRVLTPDRRRPDDCLLQRATPRTVVLAANDETVVPGRYGLWLDQGTGHARVGDIVDRDDAGTWVERELHGLDYGILAPGPCRWSSYYFGGPPDESADLPLDHVQVATELGPMPAWKVPSPDGSTDRWAILVHGRGARREETIRGVRPLHRAGFTCLSPSYRNDEGVPRGPDGRYNLGLSEWRDVESALVYALRHGAREVVLVGWSMGGAIVLQLLDRSRLAGAVSRVVLDGPVIDWGTVLAFHARANLLPRPVGTLSRTLMGRTWGKRIVGIHDVLDVASTDWVRRADELRHPMLLIHSIDDEFVPSAPSAALAGRRPDLVTWVPWDTARHCKEWNTDPERWERTVGDFVSGAGPRDR